MNPDQRKRMLAIIRNPGWVSLIWLGMVLGVSILSTPIRFTATTITRPIALDVGRVTFAALNKAEFVALIITLVIIRVAGSARTLWMPVFGLALILIAQAAWLLPELGARTDMIIAGSEPPPSIAHSVYSILEIAKVILLSYTGFQSLQLLSQGGYGRG
ncbi:MAG: hypothetical protein QGF87_01435 [Woeseiaceae bacterium]|nr:hypothetical protein [Woeseiaceae bacterium]